MSPLRIVSMQKDKCTVSWEPPTDNGGCEITNYVLEKAETRKMVYIFFLLDYSNHLITCPNCQVWSVVSSAVSACVMQVPRLVEGNEYVFRVKAENKMGIGQAIESVPAVAKSPFGMKIEMF